MDHEGLEDTAAGGWDGASAAPQSGADEDGTLWDDAAPVAARDATGAFGTDYAADETTVLTADDLAAAYAPVEDALVGHADGADARDAAEGTASPDASDAATPRPDDRRGPLTRVVRWGSAHQGCAVALGTFVALVVIAGGFALGAMAVVAGVDADVAARAEERIQSEKADADMSLPRLNMRFTSLADEAFPTVTANLAFSTSDGSALPALTADAVHLTETDETGESSEPAITGFTFDPATGACQITYVADAETLGEDRTLSVSLAGESGYRGSASMGYHAFIPEEGADVDTAEWILPDSDTHRYTASELSDLTSDELFIARNEIFARHGRMFGDSYLQQHFESTSWYEPRYTAEEFDSMKTPLNDTEIANVNTILQLEGRA